MRTRVFLVALLAFVGVGRGRPGPVVPRARSAAPSSIRRARPSAGASVLVVDESTGVPRAGRDRLRRAASRPRTSGPAPTASRWSPPTSRSTSRRAIVLRAAGVARVDVEAGAGRAHGDGHRVRGGHQQHHAGEPGHRARPRRAAAPRPAAQQPRHPVLPAPEPERARRHRRHPVPGRPHLRRLLHPGRPGLHERDLRHRSATPPPAWTRSPSCRCCRTPTARSTAAWPAWW